MSVFTIPRKQFDWPKFASAVSGFVLSRGADEVFQLVQDGQVILDMEELTFDDGEEIEDIPDDPVERLEAGFDLLAQLAMFQDFGVLVCADGSEIEVPDLDDEDLDDEEEERPPLTAAQRRLVEKTVCDECRSYGFLISLDGTNLKLQTVRRYWCPTRTATVRPMWSLMRVWSKSRWSSSSIRASRSVPGGSHEDGVPVLRQDV